MDLRRVCLALFLYLLPTACGGAGRERPTATLPMTPTAVVEQVKGAVEQWRQGFEVRSMDVLAPLYAQVPELMQVWQGRLVAGWPAAQEVIQAFFNSHPEVKVRLATVTVVALGGEGAVASATISRRFGDGVTTVEESGAIILVFRRIGDTWQIVAEHYSYAPAQ